MAGRFVEEATGPSGRGRYTSRAARWLEQLLTKSARGDDKPATCWEPGADRTPRNPKHGLYHAATWPRQVLEVLRQELKGLRDSLRKRTSTDCGWPPVTGSPDPLSSRGLSPR